MAISATTAVMAGGSVGSSSRIASLVRRNRASASWTVVLGIIVLVAILGPLFTQSASAIDPIVRLQGPSGAHWLGTDELGRDIFARVVAAAGVSLLLGAIITVISTVLGTVIGLVAGFYPRAESVAMRVVDALLAFPPLILAIALVAFLGAGALSEVIALTVVYTPFLARVVRSSTLGLRERGYVVAARGSGLGGASILARHVLPNCLPVIGVQASFIYAFALLSDAALSFLGLGVSAPTPTWGNMIAEARPYLVSQPGFIIFPGLAIVLVVMALNYLGDGLRNLIDPRGRALQELELLRRSRRRTPQSSQRSGTSLIHPNQTTVDASDRDERPTDPDDKKGQQL